MSTYPGTLDDLGATNPAGSDPMNDGAGHASQHSEANDAIDAIQATLGTDPQGGEATVAARIAALEGGGGGGGLVLVGSGTFSSDTAVDINGVFDGTYDGYKVVIRHVGVSSNTVHTLKLRASGTDSSSGYASTMFNSYGDLPEDYRDREGTDEWYAGFSADSIPYLLTIDLWGPALAAKTVGNGLSNNSYAGDYRYTAMLALWHDTTSAYDGLDFLSTNAVSGSWAVYGYVK